MGTRRYHLGLWLFICIGFLAGIFSSCTIEKRKYREGFHVEWYGKKNDAAPAIWSKEQEVHAGPLVKNIRIDSTAESLSEKVESHKNIRSKSQEPIAEASLKSEWPIVLSKDTITPDEYYSKEEPINEGINKNAEESKKLGLWSILAFISVFVLPLISGLIPILSVATTAYPLLGMALSYFCASLAIKKGKLARQEFADFPNRYTNDRDFRKGIRRGRLMMAIFIALGVLVVLFLLFLLLYLGTLF